MTAVAYPFLTAPLLGFLYTTIDLIAVALAVGAVALRGPGRDRLGAAWRSGAAAILAKGVARSSCLPVLLLEPEAASAFGPGRGAHARHLRLGVVGRSVGSRAGGHAAADPGWEYESAVGSVIWALGRNFAHHQRLEHGSASRQRCAQGTAARRGPGRDRGGVVPRIPAAAAELGFPAVAAMSILMLSAPPLSPPLHDLARPMGRDRAWMERTGTCGGCWPALMLVSGPMFLAFRFGLLYYHAPVVG